MNSVLRTDMHHGRWIVRWVCPGFGDVGAGILARPLNRDAAPSGREDVPTARLEQVHGSTVVRVAAAGITPSCDAAVTTERGLRLRVRVADCVPVFLASPGGVGLAHAGWRGTAAAISTLLVAELAAISGDDPDRMFAFIGPSIGPCCYEVGPEVSNRFAPEFRAPGSRRLDLRAANRRQLAEAGVPAASITESHLCTRCHQHLLHSHRGSRGGPGRMDAVLMRQAAPGDHCDRVFS